MALDVAIEPFISDFHPAISGFLHRPSEPNGDGLVLTHGAGSNCQSPLLRTMADTFAGAGCLVLRCNLPFRQVRPFGPPRPGDAAHDRQGLVEAVRAFRKLAPGRIFLGGHSYGGRQSTIAAAENAHIVEGLLLLSYPLHPPRNPSQLRTEHLPKLDTRALFVHGTRDPFGSIQEIEEALKLIPAKTLLLAVEGAGHDLNFGKNSGSKRKDWLDPIFESFQAFLR